MKYNYLFLVLVAIPILTASCSQDDALINSQADEKLQSYTLYLDANAPSFETELDGETRASGNSWEDGDLIYIAFSNGGNTKVSKATYKSSLGAFQFWSATLNATSEASCSVYYFRGGTNYVSNNTVTMDKYTAIFTDNSAKYACTNNVIILSAAFKPYTWRLCFKGTPNTQVKLKSISNILYNTAMNLITGSFTTNTDSATLQVNSDGYTSYIYGIFAGSSNTIEIRAGGVSYSRIIEPSKLSVGESGFFTIPTSSNLHGWTELSSYGIIDGHEYVDLGLPSGTLWATCNVGATKPEEYGGFYAWGEIEEKDKYDWNTYIHCNGSIETCHDIGDDIAGTEYDVAHVNWGGLWRMPSKDQIKELVENCTRDRINQYGLNGLVITGSNGATLFLPAAGYKKTYHLSEGMIGYFWSSELYLNQEFRAYCLFFYGAAWYHSHENRFLGFTVRPVCLCP